MFWPFRIVGSARRLRAAESPRRILYISLAFRGDLVLNFPALQAIKRKFPDAEITCWVREYNKTLAKLSPAINNVLFYDNFRCRGLSILKELFPHRQHAEFFRIIKSAAYDICIDDSGLAFSSLVAAYAKIPLRIGRNTQGFGFLNHYGIPYDFDAHLIKKRFDLLEPLGIATADEKGLIPGVSIDDNARKALLSQYGLEGKIYKYFTIQPFAGWSAKNWDNVKFGKVVAKFAEASSFQPIFIGGPNDFAPIDSLIASMRYPAINLAGKLELAETAIVISGAAIHLGVDSVGSHLAAASGVKSLTLFGPTNPRLIAVLTEKNIAIQKKTACTSAEDKIYCCKDAGRSCADVVCMSQLTYEDVFDILVLLWKNQKLPKIIES